MIVKPDLSLRLMILAAFCVGSSHAGGQCTLDLDAGILRNRLVRVEFPVQGSAGNVRLFFRGNMLSDRQWYYCVRGRTQAPGRNFRSTGKVLSVKALSAGSERAGVRLTCLTDDPDQPALGAFELTYEIEQGRPVVRHTMTFTPAAPLRLTTYDFFVATAQAATPTHRLHYLAPDWRLAWVPAKTSNAYGRISFPTSPAWVALEERAKHRILAVGAPSADVIRYQYSLVFRRFELTRDGGYVTRAHPLHDFALFAFGDDLDRLAQYQREFQRAVTRPSRNTEPSLPAPDLTRTWPVKNFGHAVRRGDATCELNAGPLRLLFDSRTGVLLQADAGAGNLLTQPGGIQIVEHPRRREVGPRGRVTKLRLEGDTLSYHWTAADVTTDNRIRCAGDRVEWEVELKNRSPRIRLFEVRLLLPVHLDDAPWFYWDGLALHRVGASTQGAALDTLHPGETLSQGIFPAVCLHDGRSGLALGMAPAQIESFYGSQVSPKDGPENTFVYTVRWALPPEATRRGRFVLYAVDPRWSWRSCVARYWSFWPDVFAAPQRDDIWGLYAATSPLFVAGQGDKFVERCRRMRVGGLEFYAPFNTTGDFYPDAEPAYRRGDRTLSRSQMQAAYVTANRAACTLSYVIPTKCERRLAQTRFADSIIRQPDGSFFLRDYWDVMGGGKEKLAAMFAWGDSFGETLQADLRRIVRNYRPDGFYLDNGAFVWQDYGRTTPWAAFDDQGRVYTNAGIAYARLQDFLAETAPQVHRNPGEFIQYFSAFRAQSHLTNIVRSQTHYIRSHRLLMGRKPIFPGHPDRWGSRSDLYDALEFGGLPWLAGLRPQREALAQAWAPVAVALARAGWQPLTNAVADRPAIRLQRFGEGETTLFTVRNPTSASLATTLTLVGLYPRLTDFFGRLALKPMIDRAARVTRVSVEVPAQRMLFLTAAPPPRRSPAIPKRAFLGQAQPTSIIIAPDASPTERTLAHCVKGFLELQAELLKKTPAVELLTGDRPPRYLNHVRVQATATVSRLSSPDEHTLTVLAADEPSARRTLSLYLDTVAKPLSETPPRWRP